MLDEQIKNLTKKAEDSVNDFWIFRISQNRTKKSQKKYQSVMGCRVRVRKSGSVTMEWYYNHFVATKGGKWRPFSKYLKRGRGYRYKDQTLLRNCQDWEIEMVRETEDHLAVLRKEYSLLVKAKTQLNVLKKYYLETEQENIDDI